MQVVPYGICLSLTSLSMILSGSIRVTAEGMISFFLWRSDVVLNISTTSALSIHLSMDI